jgi:hypothetical protein
MLLLPLRATAFRRAGLEPARRRSALPRSNRHLHHRLADIRRRTSTIAEGMLGNWRYRLSMTSTQVLLGGRTGTRGATALARLLPRYVTSKAGFEPAFPWCEVSEIFTTSLR